MYLYHNFEQIYYKYMRIKKTNLTIWLPIIISLSIILGFWLGHNRFSSNNGGISINSKKDIEDLLNSMKKSNIGQLVDYIDNNYVEKVNVDTLTEEFIPKILEKLDPHSSYIPASDVLKANENLEGSFDGIGVVFNMVTDTLIILEVISGGPSSKVGIEMGDRIIKVEGENIAGVKYNQFEVVKKLRGAGGTIVNLSIERKGEEELIEIPVVRGKVAINSIEASFMIEPEVGYIKLLRFSRTTHQEITAAIDSLLLVGMKSLIFDLTSNTGGYMDQAILIANEFLPEGEVIVYAKGRDGDVLAKNTSNGKGKFTEHKLYVLVDEFSASSSEIVAGAIQDNDRGVLIGRRTFGKGLIQQQVQLGDGSMVNLSIAKYYTPSGRCIQKPYDMGNSEKYNNDIIDRLKHMEFFTADSIVMKDTTKYYTKSGKVVYGGGGVMPDVFVPMDTTKLSKFVIKAMSNINIIKFITKYATDNNKALSKLTSIDEVKKYLDKNGDKIYNKYVNYMVANGVEITRKEALIPENKKELMPYISAYLGQYTPMGANAFYSIIYPYDNITSKAIKLAIEELKNSNQ